MSTKRLSAWSSACGSCSPWVWPLPMATDPAARAPIARRHSGATAAARRASARARCGRRARQRLTGEHDGPAGVFSTRWNSANACARSGMWWRIAWPSTRSNEASSNGSLLRVGRDRPRRPARAARRCRAASPACPARCRCTSPRGSRPARAGSVRSSPCREPISSGERPKPAASAVPAPAPCAASSAPAGWAPSPKSMPHLAS